MRRGGAGSFRPTPLHGAGLACAVPRGGRTEVAWFVLLLAALPVPGCRGQRLDCYRDEHCGPTQRCDTTTFRCVAAPLADAGDCPLYYDDGDGDTYGSRPLGRRCEAPDHATLRAGDCDDSDPNVHPDATETPYNGRDDDCDPTGTPDDDLDRDGHRRDDDCDDSDPGRFPGNPDTCPGDGVDQDCNHQSDDGEGCLVPVPRGEYLLGGEGGERDPPPYAPVHRVVLSPFRIGAYEVTNAQVARAVERGILPPSVQSRPRPNGYPPDYATRADFARYPAVGLTHAQAATFCEVFFRGRLPTEAEWEAAAGGIPGNRGRTYPWKAPPALPDCNTANFAAEPPCSSPQPEGPVPADALPAGCTQAGACAMAGNAAEWVADYYDPRYYEVLADADPPARDPTGPGEGIQGWVVRGGSWLSPADRITTYFREGRTDAGGGTGWEDVGFRCVLPGSGE